MVPTRLLGAGALRSGCGMHGKAGQRSSDCGWGVHVGQELNVSSTAFQIGCSYIKMEPE